MRRLKTLTLAAAFTLGLAAGIAFAPPAEALSDCFRDDCNICCYLPGGGITCTDRACPE
jgi:hypothetical protein